jgi:hypothetical protein
MKLWLLMALMVLLTGCASMSEQECLDAGASSWEGVGIADGQDGWSPDQRLEMHREACSEVGVRPDRKTYMKGWTRGVLDYCTPDRGYSVGLYGSSGNSSVCPGNTGILFEENVQLGLRVYNLKREISQTEDEIRDFQKKLDNKNLDRETSRDLHAKLRHRDEALTRLRVLLIEAQSIPVIR